MNPDAPQPPPDEREARLTALLLGELPVAEAEALRAEIAADAELAKVFRRLSLAHELTRETVRSPEPKELAKPEPLQLSAERRAALLAKFKTPPSNVVPLPKRERQPRFDWRELIAVAAMLVAVVGAAGMLLPSLAKAKSKSQGFVGPQISDLPGQSAAMIAQTPLPSETAEVAERIQPRTENESRNQVLADTPAPVPPPPSEPSQNPKQLDQVLARRSGIARAENRVLAEAESTAEVASDVVAVDPSSVTFAVEVKGATVTSPALAGGVGGGRAGGPGLNNWAFNGVTPNSPANAAAPAAVALGFQPSPSVEVNSNPESSARLLDRETEPLARESEQVGKSVELFARTPAAGRQFFDATGLINAPANGPTADFRGELAAARPQSDDYSETAAGHGVAAARKDFGTVAVDPADRSNGRLDGFYRFIAPTKPADKFAPGEQALDLKRRSAVGQKEGDLIEERFGVALAAPKLEKTVEEFRGGKPALGAVRLAPQRDDGPVPPANQAGVELRGMLAEPGVAQITERTESPATSEQVPSRPTVLASLADGRDGKSAAASPAQSTRLADIMALGQQVAAYQPEATQTDYLGLATNAALPALGDVPVLGARFKGLEAKERVAEEDTKQRARAEAMYQLVLSKTKEYSPADPTAPGEVVMIDRASAETDPSLFSKLRAALGNGHSATARIQIDPASLRHPAGGRAANDAVSGLQAHNEGTKSVIQSNFQFEVESIKSRPILEQVAKQLSLGGGEDGLRKLAETISVKPIHLTRLVEISANDADPAKAALIANTVAEVYTESKRDPESPRALAGARILRQPADPSVQQAVFAQPPQSLARNSATDPQWIGVLEHDSDRPLPKLAPGAPEPQPEVTTADNAFSTFSLNVSDVSFKLAAAALEKGQMPEPATVRTEEFINAFDYRDPEPAGPAPVAFAWERARYPFAHDRDLVRFSVKTAASGRQPGRPLNLVLLLDNSGSMERADRVRIRQECLRVLAGQLQPQDRVSVVAFARTPRLWVDGLAGAQAAELPGRVGELTPDGGTNLEEALRVAYQTAARHFAANGVNRVVLLTDGAANLGDVQPDSLKQQVEANRQQGIALDCFGIGWEGFNDELLEVLSRNGDGRYGFVNTPEAAQSEFAGQLVGALQIAASDVKVQVEWNPRRVTAYRQLGYAKHQLKKEQFRDNTVDAAEIGAAEAGNALYTVQVNPAGEGPLGTVRVRFKVPGTGDYREHEWPLHYDGTARPLDQAGPALRLAAGASAFSEWLVSSPWAAEVTPDRLLGLLNGVTDAYAADPRPKQFEQMLRQAKSVSGK